jgi:hypothetical protein
MGDQEVLEAALQYFLAIAYRSLGIGWIPEEM